MHFIIYKVQVSLLTGAFLLMMPTCPVKFETTAVAYMLSYIRCISQEDVVTLLTYTNI